MTQEISEAAKTLREWLENDKKLIAAVDDGFGGGEIKALRMLLEHVRSGLEIEKSREHFARLLALLDEEPSGYHRRRMLRAGLAFYGTE